MLISLGWGFSDVNFEAPYIYDIINGGYMMIQFRENSNLKSLILYFQISRNSCFNHRPKLEVYR